MKLEVYTILELVYMCLFYLHLLNFYMIVWGILLSKLKKEKDKIVLELNSLHMLECESCQLGKHVRSYFPENSKSRCNFLFIYYWFWYL